MGIPVAVFGAPYSFASQHPVLAGLAIVTLIAVAVFAIWASRKLPERMGKMRVGMFVAFVAVAVGVNWAMFKPEPSLGEQLLKSMQQSATAN